MLEKETKICINCKRDFTNRKKWSKRGVWEKVKYCSKRCSKEYSAKSNIDVTNKIKSIKLKL